MNIDKKRFYIFDANEKMIGNPFGYKTHSSAEAQVNRRGYTVYMAIKKAYYQAKATDPNHTLVHSIKIGELV